MMCKFSIFATDMKLFTPVEASLLPISISLSDRITVLGSCFADGMGARLSASGFSLSLNPFGTLYNPLSIADAVARMDSACAFTEANCVEMGAGAGLICSFSHHTSFARAGRKEFLDNANSRLQECSEAWKASNKVIITLGTAFVWRLKESGRVVANCLKLPSALFSREMMSCDQVVSALEALVTAHPEKQFIFTVSPIRHMSDGAHSNTLSKATLQLALDELTSRHPQQCCYFPAYEILLDELRDYRFFADDLVHPSSSAVEIIWERFTQACIPAGEHTRVISNEKAYRRSLHRQMH